MTLTSEDLNTLRRAAEEAARNASQYISSRFRSKVALSPKSGGESMASQVVTEVDLISQRLILEVLIPTCSAFNIAVLTEESPDDGGRFSAPYFWCIDPLDGTLAFSRGEPGFAVSIALIRHDGQPLIGVVADPVTGDIFSAEKNNGALRNGDTLFVRKVGDIENPALTAVFDSHYLDGPHFAKTSDILQQVSLENGWNGVNFLSGGGAVINALRVLDHPPGCYFKLPKAHPGGGSLWDYAATALIVAEAGGAVSDMFGAPLDLNRRDSLFMNHRGVLFASGQKLSRVLQQYFGALIG